MKKKSLMHSIAAAPHIFWAVLFIVLPLIIVAFYAFTDDSGAFSFENILALSEYGPIFLLSVELSVIATAICLIHKAAVLALGKELALTAASFHTEFCFQGRAHINGIQVECSFCQFGAFHSIK